MASLERITTRPPGADVRVTARFLAGGVLGVIGAWLCEDQPSRSPEQLVEALTQCLPGWLNAASEVDVRDLNLTGSAHQVLSAGLGHRGSVRFVMVPLLAPC